MDFVFLESSFVFYDLTNILPIRTFCLVFYKRTPVIGPIWKDKMSQASSQAILELPHIDTAVVVKHPAISLRFALLNKFGWVHS